MCVFATLPMFGHEDRDLVSCSSHYDLIGRIAVKRLRQSTTVDQDGPSQIGDEHPGYRRRLIQPLIERPVKHKLPLFDRPGDLPRRDQRDRQLATPR